MRGPAAIALSCAVSFSANAGDLNNTFAVRGVGQATCGSLVNAAENDPILYRQFGGYLNGLITGLNLEREETFDVVLFEDTETLMLYVLKACKAGLDQPYFQAARKVIEAMMPTRVSQFESFVEQEAPQKIVLYRQAFGDAVSKLIELNFLQSGTYDASDPVLRTASGCARRARDFSQSIRMASASINSFT
jgi:hypothetical protein